MSIFSCTPSASFSVLLHLSFSRFSPPAFLSSLYTFLIFLFTLNITSIFFFFLVPLQPFPSPFSILPSLCSLAFHLHFYVIFLFILNITSILSFSLYNFNLLLYLFLGNFLSLYSYLLFLSFLFLYLSFHSTHLSILSFPCSTSAFFSIYFS